MADDSREIAGMWAFLLPQNKQVVTVWKTGAWEAAAARVAFYAQSDPGYLVTVAIEGDGQLAGDQPFVITVWKDGTWQVWGALDAYYAQNDPTWLVTIPLKDLPRRR